MNEFAMLVPIPDSMPAEEIADHASALWRDAVEGTYAGDPVVRVLEYAVIRDERGEVVFDPAEWTDPETGETWVGPRRTARVSGTVL